MAYQREAQSVDVAARLHDLREEQGISMRALAQKSGLSANALSMIERGRASPSVSTLSKLADALGISITEFFGHVQTRRACCARTLRPTHAVSFARGFGRARWGEVRRARRAVRLDARLRGIQRNPVDCAHRSRFVYCLRGKLEYLVHDRRYELEPGDSLLFAAHLRHRWRNPGKTVTNAIIVLSGFVEGRSPHSLQQDAE